VARAYVAVLWDIVHFLLAAAADEEASLSPDLAASTRFSLENSA
jgi:hypothetical protein